MNKFSNALFNWFTQNPTGRDEREQGVLEHKLAVMFLITYILIVILGTVSLIIDMMRETVSFGTVCLLVLSVILTFASLWINRRNRLDELKATSAEAYKYWVKKLALKCAFLVVYFAVMMFIITGVIFPYIFNDGFDFKAQFIRCVISGVLFGGVMFIYYMMMLKKEY
ncbi:MULTISPECIES: hypothetical protein [Staphylococcus]|uniref:hypothetical protein n=1 Tax=Staphylococcus sp. HMSC34C02 TaxID=1608858 RepID=UPI0008A998C3|nr:hypothetical protein [Staphylococcus sp. HMSC34C02]OHR80174.1 hypothetical protein HMPREF3239_03930 [Staphylococcus sp. HMSC34C02]